MYVGNAPKQRGPKSTVVPSVWWYDEFGRLWEAGLLKRFPPPAENTPMRWCCSGERRCQRFNPFYYGAVVTRRKRSAWVCEDCRQALLAEWEHRLRDLGLWPEWRREPGSRFSEALAYLRDTHQRIVELELEPDSEAALMMEIEASS